MLCNQAGATYEKPRWKIQREKNYDRNSESSNADTMETSTSRDDTTGAGFQKVERKQIRFCKYCGCRHGLEKKYCKSYGKVCDFCHRFNHDTKVCWFRPERNIRIESSKSKGKAAKDATYNIVGTGATSRSTSRYSESFSKSQNILEDQRKGLKSFSAEECPDDSLNQSELKDSQKENDPGKNVKNDDLGSKEKEEHDTLYCSDNRLIREIQEQMDIQWFESVPTKEMMIS